MISFYGKFSINGLFLLFQSIAGARDRQLIEAMAVGCASEREPQVYGRQGGRQAHSIYVGIFHIRQ